MQSSFEELQHLESTREAELVEARKELAEVQRCSPLASTFAVLGVGAETRARRQVAKDQEVKRP